MRLFIEPVEPLLFRDGRPFNAGENNFASSLFPPNLETIQGAIRATIASCLLPNATPAQAFSNEVIKDLIGYKNGNNNYYGRFRITGFSLGRYEKEKSSQHIVRLFPVPTCILQEEEGEKRQVRLKPRTKERSNEEHISTNLPKDLQLIYPETTIDNLQGKIEPLKGWITEQALHDFLQNGGAIPADDIISNNAIYTQESRMGIGIVNAAKAAQEGLLYQLQMIRMNHDHTADYRYGFVVDVSLAPKDDRDTKDSQRYLNSEQTYEQLKLGTTRFPDEGWMTLGGERRAARFEIVKKSDPTQSNLDSAKSGSLVYLATPAALTRGWQPGNWSDIGIATAPIAVAIDRYQPIGGWQLDPNHSGGQGKTMRRCVPAGTVYYFDDLVQVTQPLTNYGTEIGYGIAYAGEY